MYKWRVGKKEALAKRVEEAAFIPEISYADSLVASGVSITSLVLFDAQRGVAYGCGDGSCCAVEVK